MFVRVYYRATAWVLGARDLESDVENNLARRSLARTLLARLRRAEITQNPWILGYFRRRIREHGPLRATSFSTRLRRATYSII